MNKYTEISNYVFKVLLEDFNLQAIEHDSLRELGLDSFDIICFLTRLEKKIGIVMEENIFLDNYDIINKIVETLIKSVLKGEKYE
jgi:acyl carrier protein